MKSPAELAAPMVRAERTYTRAQLLEAIRAERHACSIVVWMTLQDAISTDADDLGLDGWMREAERRVKNRHEEHDAAERSALAQVAQPDDATAFIKEWLSRQGNDENYMTTKARTILAAIKALGQEGTA